MSTWTFTDKTIDQAAFPDFFKRSFADDGDSAATYYTDGSNITVDTTLAEIPAEAAVDEAIAETSPALAATFIEGNYTILKSDKDKVLMGNPTAARDWTLPVLTAFDVEFTFFLINKNATFDVTILGIDIVTDPICIFKDFARFTWTGDQWQYSVVNGEIESPD